MTRKKVENFPQKRAESFQSVSSPSKEGITRVRGVERFPIVSIPTKVDPKLIRGVERFTGLNEKSMGGIAGPEFPPAHVFDNNRASKRPKVFRSDAVLCAGESKFKESSSSDELESNEDVTDELELEEKMGMGLDVQGLSRPIPPPTISETLVPIKPRPYQIEIFEESLERNIIVCLPTGSGKTLVAILRISHELEHGPNDKICWFLVPTQILGAQQFDVLKNGLPQVPMRFVSGADNTDKWEKETWIDVLGMGNNSDPGGLVRVVVSTHQILLDVLSHGFVTMDRLSLIVFDEAHYCRHDHPAHRIMKDFYHLELQRCRYVPAILGLTASPVFSGQEREMRIIEENLNAICRTPSIHSSDLDKHAKRPTIEALNYSDNRINGFGNDSYVSLEAAYRTMLTEDDPYVKSLPIPPQKLKETYCQKQMKAFVSRSRRVLEQFGDWATDFYIDTVKRRFTKAVEEENEELVGLQNEEKLYLVNLLRGVHSTTRTSGELGREKAITPKVDALISRLVSEYTKNAKDSKSEFSGLIFVEQRVDVTILSEIVSRHPKTKGIFRCGPLMGSNPAMRPKREMYELIDARTCTSALAEFREGLKNLIIATNVAEEGLDIPGCHLVVCFDLPTTIKSFIQKRGRARKLDSIYVLMFRDQEGQSCINTYKEMEDAMIKAYQDETRQLPEPTEEEKDDSVGFYIEATGARLTYTSAIPHIFHFCAVVARGEHVDPTPHFQCVRDEDGYLCHLTLPSCVLPEIRQHCGVYKWKSEKMAKRDAAYHAYIKLYEEGLVDDNLMPKFKDDPELRMEDIKKKTSQEDVQTLMDIWGTQWTLEGMSIKAFATDIQLLWFTGERTEMVAYLPFELPKIRAFKLWWTPDHPVEVIFGTESTPILMTKERFSNAQEATYILLYSIHRNRMPESQRKQNFPYLFVPKIRESITSDALDALDAYIQLGDSVRQLGIVRNLVENGKPYIFRNWVTDQSLSEEDLDKRYRGKQIEAGQPLLEASPLSKRKNFYHKGSSYTKYDEEQEQRVRDFENRKVYLLPQFCKFDLLPWTTSKIAFLVPSIIRRIEVYAIARSLQDTVLSPVQIENIDLILEAICASSAGEDVHYQRLEILGDSVLKLLVGVQIAAEYPKWPEGYLSAKKDRSVANSKLASESIKLGMARFIITNRFTTYKWRPRYIGSLPEQSEAVGRRSMSTKILADVVESLIGAAFLESGYNKAVKMAEVFGLDVNWQPMSTRLNALYGNAISGEEIRIPEHLRDLERMIGYEFDRKSLLIEAMTHPGYNADARAVSYQRLEFLGDSVLDMIAVEQIFHHRNCYSHVDIHRYKSSTVTADFLAFQCMGLEETIKEADKLPEVDRTGKVEVVSKDRTILFHRYLRHSHSEEILRAQERAYKKYLELKDEITNRLYHGEHFPWTLLASLDADKFFSDIVESILGAVFVDTQGNWGILRDVTRRFGILQVLERSLDDRVDVVQPVSKLGVHAAAKLRDVKYEVGVENKSYWCTVKVNGQELVRESNGTKRSEIKMRAAERAYAVLVEQDRKEVLNSSTDKDKELPTASISDENEKVGGVPMELSKLSKTESE